MLGIDPGLAETGYALLGSDTSGIAVLASGVIDTQPDTALEGRVHQLYEALDALLVRSVPDLLVLEDLYAEYRFPRTALLMAHARGVICLAARQHRVAILPLAPGEAKRAVAGHGAASKAQVERGVQRLLALDAPPRPSHVADALALAFTGLSRTGGRWR